MAEGKNKELWREFLKEHHVMSVAVSNNEDLWCFNAFYALKEKEGRPYLIFTSLPDTLHMQLAHSGILVAGTVALETEMVGKIRGLQFKARMVEVGSGLLDPFRVAYLKRFPYAILKGGDLWCLEILKIKYTDNRLGFGKKINKEFID